MRALIVCPKSGLLHEMYDPDCDCGADVIAVELRDPDDPYHPERESRLI